MKVAICFVCLGNICRSPTAWGVMRALVAREKLDAHFVIESAGTAGYHVGEGADQRTIAHAKKRGIDLRAHRARQFTKEDFARFDLVLAADRDNVAALLRMAPDEAARAKVRLLRSYDVRQESGAEKGEEREGREREGSEVPDPYYGGGDGFEEVLDVCEAACAALLAELNERRHI